MDETNKKEGKCMGWCCGSGTCHHHRWFRLVITVIVILIAFWLGTIHGRDEAYSHHGYMREMGGWGSQMMYYQGGMMQQMQGSTTPKAP